MFSKKEINSIATDAILAMHDDVFSALREATEGGLIPASGRDPLTPIKAWMPEGTEVSAWDNFGTLNGSVSKSSRRLFSQMLYVEIELSPVINGKRVVFVHYRFVRSSDGCHCQYHVISRTTNRCGGDSAFPAGDIEMKLFLMANLGKLRDILMQMVKNLLIHYAREREAQSAREAAELCTLNEAFAVAMASSSMAPVRPVTRVEILFYRE